MASRLKLDAELRKLLNSNNVYFQPPESVRMKYPCFVYKLSRPDVIRADNMPYQRTRKYDLTYITFDPDDPLIDEIEGHFLMCRLDRTYPADNLNHYNYTLYY